MARIPYPENLSPEVRDLLGRLGGLNVNRMMAHSIPVLEGFSRMGRNLLGKGKLDAALRELAILRIGVVCKSEYEWHQHVTYARAVGASEASIEAMRTGKVEGLSEREQLVVAFCDEIVRDGVVSPATFARGQKQFDNGELVELVMVAGCYQMTAAFLRTFEIDIEKDVPSLGETVAKRLKEMQAKK